jgi:hypothetical protein
VTQNNRRHGRACPGHPRGSTATMGQPRTVASAKPRQIAFGCLSLAHGVDGRDKPDHDASML